MTEVDAQTVYRWFEASPGLGGPRTELSSFAFMPRRDETDGLSFQRKALALVMDERPAAGVASITCPRIEEAYRDNGVDNPWIDSGDPTHLLTKIIDGKKGHRKVAKSLSVRAVAERFPT